MDSNAIQGRPSRSLAMKIAIHGGLFLLSFFTMMLAVSWPLLSVSPEAFWQEFWGGGFLYALTLASILGAHEMGHYWAARYHKLDVSLPYFLPAPPPLIFGTFGAFIRLKEPVEERRALLDVGAAGPICGLLVALPALFLGLSLSEVSPITEAGLYEGNSLIYLLIKRLVVGPIPSGHDVFLHPVAWAAWIGLLVTTLNLFPVGQLDGGHISCALLGKARHKRLSEATYGGLIGLALALIIWDGEPVWLAWVVLITFIGLKHPPVAKSSLELNRFRRLIGWACLAIFALSFTPVPLSREPAWGSEKIEQVIGDKSADGGGSGEARPSDRDGGTMEADTSWSESAP